MKYLNRKLKKHCPIDNGDRSNDSANLNPENK